MGICCSKKSSNFKSDTPIQKKPNLNSQIGKNPEEKIVIQEKPIIKHRRINEIKRRSDDESLNAVQKNGIFNPKIDKNPEGKKVNGDKPIIKHRKSNEIERQVEEKSSKLVQNNPNLNPQIDKIPKEKTEIKGKPIIKYRTRNEFERRPDEESNQNPNPETDKIEEPIIKHRNSNEIERRFDVEITKPNQKPISLVSNCIKDDNLVTNVDEVDAILIQCGRLSRCSSAAQTPKRSKRSHDSDQEAEDADVASRRRSRPSPNRKRTPGTERGEKERRVSKSPGRRSDDHPLTCRDHSGGAGRPGKMVYVPATDKEGPTVVKRALASPRRSRSPAARANSRVSSEIYSQNGNNNNKNSRKAEQSPSRRNPLGEIDQNAVNNSGPQKQSLENDKNSRTKTKHTNQAEEHLKAPSQTTNNNALTRTRSSRLSRDLDNLDSNPPSSYTALLLEDIQSFHNKNPTVNVPQCLSKACSILDQIADLNSSKGCTEGLTMEKYANRLLENKEPPLMETEVVSMNDLVEPSFQKYVTVMREDVEREGEESSGSNSFSGVPQHWISSSLWETNSTDSNELWASSTRSSTRDSKSNTKEGDGKKREIDLRRGLHSKSAITSVTN